MSTHTIEAVRHTNPARVALTVVGVLLVIAGAITAAVAGSHIGYDQSVSDYTGVLQGGNPNASTTSAALTGDYIGVWVGVGLGVFGLILITARIIIGAAHRQEP